jgi:DNA-binding MarR family transcriptional regulator
MATLDAELQAAHGMSLGDYEVLVALSESPERRLRMTDLAGVLHLSPSGLTRRLDVLAKRGWVTRERCPSDRRGTFAVLTDDGYDRLVEAAPTHVRGVREHLVDRLTARQLANLAGALGPLAPVWPPEHTADDDADRRVS